MATRSNIRVILKEEDRNREMKFNPELIGRNSDGKYFIYGGTWGKNQLTIENALWSPVNPNGVEALRIYHHWDGYPEGVGKTLLEHYNSYEDALNLMLGGYCSSINDSYSPYALREIENWESIQPDTIDENSGICEEWDYMFKDGEWFVRDGYEIKDWMSLSEYFYKN